MKYEIGDIVWVAEFENYKDKAVDHHYFVVIDDDGNIVPADYFGFVVSSNIKKSKYNSSFKYNEPIKKDSINRLNTDSIVKCDQLFNIPKETIVHKLGTVKVEDMIRFLNTYKNFIEENKNM